MAKNWKQLKYLSTGECIGKLYTDTRALCSKNNKILIFATIMNLKMTMASKKGSDNLSRYYILNNSSEIKS